MDGLGAGDRPGCRPQGSLGLQLVPSAVRHLKPGSRAVTSERTFDVAGRVLARRSTRSERRSRLCWFSASERRSSLRQDAEASLTIGGISSSPSRHARDDARLPSCSRRRRPRGCARTICRSSISSCVNPGAHRHPSRCSHQHLQAYRAMSSRSALTGASTHVNALPLPPGIAGDVGGHTDLFRSNFAECLQGNGR